MTAPAKQIFTAFWEGYTTSGTGLAPPLAATPPTVDVLCLAFGNLFPGNVITHQYLLKAHSEDEIRAGIAALRQSAPDMKILLSIIGTPFPVVGWNDAVTDANYFARYLLKVKNEWGFDGFDIDNEDLDTFPADAFVATVKEMRQVMPEAILTLDTYRFNRDSAVIAELADDLTAINTMAYFERLAPMQALVEQYASVIDASKISIGVKSAPIDDQGTSLQDSIALAMWNPTQGAKRGMMLWDLSLDIQSVTGMPDGSWTNRIAENLP